MHACSIGQSEKALLARVHTLEREKAMLAEQVQSAQAMLRSYMETEHYRPSITRDSSINSEPTQVHVMSACKYIYIYISLENTHYTCEQCTADIRCSQCKYGARKAHGTAKRQGT